MAFGGLSGTISLAVHGDHPLNLEKASARQKAHPKGKESREHSGKDVRLHFRFLPLSPLSQNIARWVCPTRCSQGTAGTCFTGTKFDEREKRALCQGP